jgi:hypothetical protein
MPKRRSADPSGKPEVEAPAQVSETTNEPPAALLLDPAQVVPELSSEQVQLLQRLRQLEILVRHGIDLPPDLKLKLLQPTATPRAIDAPQQVTLRHGRMSRRRSQSETDETGIMLEDGSFVQNGVRYFPLSAAAPRAQAPPSTILHWIKKETKFGGRPLDSYHFAPANRYYLSEESIGRAANRFIKWPSREPAGPVTVGHADDQSGYVRLQEAAQTLGVDHHTIWRWATKGTTPTDEPLDVIKCPATDQFYICEADISKLKKLVPRSGLRAGRRQSPTPRPS